MSTPPDSLTIPPRFAGPPGSANGGYTSGRLAACLTTGGPVTVTLWRPPPLSRALRVECDPDECRLLDDEDLVAVARRDSFQGDAPTVVSIDQAACAEPSYAGRAQHPFPTCFVCGPDRKPGDGMLLSPGRGARGQTACRWTPDASLAAGEGEPVAAVPFVWAALDCPAGWASDIESRPLVLGRMTAECERLPPVGESCVVVGAVRGTERKKTFTSSALYDRDGALLARAEHTWIAVDPLRF
jgi:hypothetical protein